jgi:hypothetical protein
MAGRKPGAPKTGGRQKGTPNRATAAKAAEIAATGLTPLDYMLDMLRDTSQPLPNRMWAAEKAAPFVHPKLAAVEHSGTIDQRHTATDMTDEQLAAIAAGRSTGAATTPPSPRQLN